MTPQDLPELDTYNVRPGDVIIVQPKTELRPAHMGLLRELLDEQEARLGLKFLVVSPELDLTLYRPVEAAS